jgi:hypothetical protein
VHPSIEQVKHSESQSMQVYVTSSWNCVSEQAVKQKSPSLYLPFGQVKQAEEPTPLQVLQVAWQAVHS